MQDSQLLVVIIDTPNSNRSQPLIKSLSSDSRFDVVLLSACMLKSYSEVRDYDIEVNTELFQVFHRRKMSPQEIGCATSHNIAREFILESGNIGIILEDDARINDVSVFFESVTKVFANLCDSNAVLSLTHGMDVKHLIQAPKDVKAIRLYGNPPLAVAYALTPIAAKKLIEANTPVRYVSDWPDAGVNFYCLSEILVIHGDENTKSTIDVTGDMRRLKRNWVHTVEKWLFLDFLLRARKIVPLNSYYRNQFRQPVLRIFDILHLEIMKIWQIFK